MTTLRTVDNKRYTTGSDKKHYVKSINIIEHSNIVYDNTYAKNKVLCNSILNSLSLPIRYMVDRVIGSVLAQTRQGEGRGNPDPTLTLSHPPQCRKLQKDILSIVRVSFLSPKQ